MDSNYFALFFKNKYGIEKVIARKLFTIEDKKYRSYKK